jgi:hypothetical protein
MHHTPNRREGRAPDQNRFARRSTPYSRLLLRHRSPRRNGGFVAICTIADEKRDELWTAFIGAAANFEAHFERMWNAADRI